MLFGQMSFLINVHRQICSGQRHACCLFSLISGIIHLDEFFLHPHGVNQHALQCRGQREWSADNTGHRIQALSTMTALRDYDHSSLHRALFYSCV